LSLDSAIQRKGERKEDCDEGENTRDGDEERKFIQKHPCRAAQKGSAT